MRNPCICLHFFLLDIKVSVSNVGGDEDFLIRAGEDIEMQATVTGKLTGVKSARSSPYQ